MSRLLHALSLFSLLSLAVLYFSGVDIVNTLSPQGCRMSWMSPSYVLQPAFNRSWSPLAGRYSLWLYREVGWESNDLHGAPVLFIPGNAGSSHQVRSIASSAARQFYDSAYHIAPEFDHRSLKALDFFAVEFNEDLSAFHGTTLDSQSRYASRAIDHILGLYSSGTPIIIMGHSMGGIVAVSLLPHPNISAIITMSTPHTLPPARFDRYIDRIYTANQDNLARNPTPILSLCGGATDLMIPSESCILPTVDREVDAVQPYRRSIFTSALEGSWTGVGHLAMVWCHQVRWRIARAALELGATSSASSKSVILDTWLRDGHRIPPRIDDTYGRYSDHLDLESEEVEVLPSELNLVLKNPHGSHTYILPGYASTFSKKFILYVSQGSIIPTSPQTALPLRASVFLCPPQGFCTRMVPSSLKLVPSPIPGRPFPVPDEGSDESEGVVVFEADIEVTGDMRVAVKVEGADGRGWIVGGFVQQEALFNNANSVVSLASHVSIALNNSIHTTLRFPRLLSSALIVYRLIPKFSDNCRGALLYPLLAHTSHPSETHYFPLSSTSPILLHTHASAPYISSTYSQGLNLTVYSTGESTCALEELAITVDWWGSIGRWGVRYAAPAASWAVGVNAIVSYDAWDAVDQHLTMPTVIGSLSVFSRRRLPWLCLLSFAVSLIPLPASLWLGNRGEPLLALIAPLMLVIVTGIVSITWSTMRFMMWSLSFIHRLLRSEDSVVSKRGNALLSLAIISLLIFFLVPWQVAFLGCWIYHLFVCSAPTPISPPVPSAIPLVPWTSDDNSRADQSSPPPVQRAPIPNQQSGREHLLLLMTWLLPLAAPVLAVWVRTLLTAGITTPFDGDHNVFNVLPFLILVDPGWTSSWVWTMNSGRIAVKPKWTLLVLALAAFFVGPRSTYVVFEVTSGILGAGLLARAVQRHWV